MGTISGVAAGPMCATINVSKITCGALKRGPGGRNMI